MISNILSIHGMSGLYKLISRNRNCIIVESLSEKKRASIPMEKKMISLGDIAIYTEETEMPLRQVFSSIKEKFGAQKLEIDPKSAAEVLVKWFFDVLPSFDIDRVYPSDIKKVIVWYNLLVENGIVDFDEEEQQENDIEK